MNKQPIQLSTLIGASTPRAVIGEVRRIFLYHYPSRQFSAIGKNNLLVKKLFAGDYPGYRRCNTEYHDFSHTIDATLATARLVDGYNIRNDPLPQRLVVNLLNAALLHDTGYIQEDWDREGTGAKYTISHVERSTEFVRKNRAAFSIRIEDLDTISRLIRSTGLSVSMDSIPFATKEEKIAGCMLGTADLLGQMSDRTYLEKLIFLYNEFREAGIAGFATEFDLIKKTVDFYEITKKRMDQGYQRVYRYAREHFSKRYSVRHNLYMEAIERHISYLHTIIADDTTNFRHKLKRADWIHAYPRTADSRT